MISEGTVMRSGTNHRNDHYSKELVIRLAKENGWRLKNCSDGEVEAIATVVFNIEKKNECISMSSFKKE